MLIFASTGGANWWGTLTGRLRAQSVWNKPSTREGKPHRRAAPARSLPRYAVLRVLCAEPIPGRSTKPLPILPPVPCRLSTRALRDPSAYALSGRLRASVPYGRTTLRAWAELDSLEGYIPTGARDSLSADAQGPHSAEGQGSKKHPLRLRLSAHASKLIPGHDVSAEGSMSERAASSLALDASSTTVRSGLSASDKTVWCQASSGTCRHRNRRIASNRIIWSSDPPPSAPSPFSTELLTCLPLPRAYACNTCSPATSLSASKRA